MVDLKNLLDHCEEHVRIELGLNKPEVVDVDDFDPATDTSIEARRWIRVNDAVAVVADLKSSTKLDANRHAASTASIYEAALKPVVDIMYEFDAGHIAVQGDCVIGVFWGDAAVRRAFCAAVTAKTFSEKTLVKKLDSKWPNAPSTGFKIGMAMSSVLVKKIGRPRTEYQALVWPGKALNYAVKAAQSGDVGRLIITPSVWDDLEDNDYVTHSCACAEGAVPSVLWSVHPIDKLDEDDDDHIGRSLGSKWCANCGEEFCAAILEGKKRRPDVEAQQDALRMKRFEEALEATDRAKKANRRNLRTQRTGS